MRPLYYFAQKFEYWLNYNSDQNWSFAQDLDFPKIYIIRQKISFFNSAENELAHNGCDDGNQIRIPVEL